MIKSANETALMRLANEVTLSVYEAAYLSIQRRHDAACSCTLLMM